MGVARCIASAIRYLHNESIIYRDLKPENVGFDHDGVVKIFDFGLSKRLLADDRTSDGMYRLTGNTGSLRYMAPEVAMNQFYNTKADSYSFAIVFWQLCSLTVPYAGYNVRSHADLVVGRGHRPKIERSWPVSWSHLMTTCWSTDIRSRLDFDRIVEALNDEYEVLISRRNGGKLKDVRAKRKNKVDAEEIELKLDVDTRIGDVYSHDEDDVELTGHSHPRDLNDII